MTDVTPPDSDQEGPGRALVPHGANQDLEDRQVAFERQRMYIMRILQDATRDPARAGDLYQRIEEAVQAAASLGRGPHEAEAIAEAFSAGPHGWG